MIQNVFSSVKPSVCTVEYKASVSSADICNEIMIHSVRLFIFFNQCYVSLGSSTAKSCWFREWQWWYMGVHFEKFCFKDLFMQTVLWTPAPGLISPSLRHSSANCCLWLASPVPTEEAVCLQFEETDQITHCISHWIKCLKWQWCLFFFFKKPPLINMKITVRWQCDMVDQDGWLDKHRVTLLPTINIVCSLTLCK